jgi:TatD DNase family protein
VIDLHCHLDLYSDPRAVAAECAKRRLYVLSVTTTPSAYQGTLALAPSPGRVRTALGLHPELVAQRHGELPLFERLVAGAAYVGEIGLDASPDHRQSLELQCTVLSHILKICAAAGGKKMSLHSRGATGKILDLLDATPRAGTPVLHWYLGTRQQVARAAGQGAWFSVGPSMMRSQRGRAAVAAMPRDRVLPESDGPFGTIDGRPAYPWEAWKIVSPLASLWQIGVAEVEVQLIANFRKFVA